MIRAPLLCLMVVLLTGCGFQPLHGKTNDMMIEVGTYLAATKVQSQNRRVMEAKQLEIAIADRLNPTSSSSLYDTAFVLEVDFNKSRRAAIVERTGVIGRYDIELTSRYRLYDAETREELDNGIVRSVVSFYNAPEKYAAYMAEKDAVQRGIIEMSEDYKLRLASFFAREYKLGLRQPAQ